jgi:hypothetical protein
MEKKNLTGPDNTEKMRVYPDSDYTLEDYYKDFELVYLGFYGVPDRSGANTGVVEKEGNDKKGDHPAG